MHATPPEARRETPSFSDPLNSGRLIGRDGRYNILGNKRRLRDFLSYSTLLQTSWPAFLLFVVLSFLAVNLLFQILYLLCGPGALAGNGPSPAVSRAARAFFFSVHTFTTVGFGNVVPVGTAANTLVAFESFIGLFGFSLVTGLLFARFSRPATRLRFSRLGVLQTRGSAALLFRVTNTSRTEVIQVEASATVAVVDVSDPSARRYLTLPLEDDRIALLPLTWTLVHRITPESPLHGMGKDHFKSLRGEVILQVSGLDVVSSQVIRARTSYTVAEIIWGGTFAEVYRRDEQTGLLDVDLSRFDVIEAEPIEAVVPSQSKPKL